MLKTRKNAKEKIQTFSSTILKCFKVKQGVPKILSKDYLININQVIINFNMHAL